MSITISTTRKMGRLVSGGQLINVDREISQDRIAAAEREFKNKNFAEAARLFELSAAQQKLLDEQRAAYEECKQRANEAQPTGSND